MAEIFRGKEGIKTVWDDMLATGAKETRWIGSGRYVPKAMPAYFKHWNERRVRQKTKWINLLRDDMRGEVIAPYTLEVLKFLPPEFSGNPIVICTYGNKVVNFQFGDPLFAFVIGSKELAENYRRYHSYLWKNVAKA